MLCPELSQLFTSDLDFFFAWVVGGGGGGAGIEEYEGGGGGGWYRRILNVGIIQRSSRAAGWMFKTMN